MPKRAYETKMKLKGKVKRSEWIRGCNWTSYKRPPMRLSELRKMANRGLIL
jgi:hypothetical protein